MPYVTAFGVEFRYTVGMTTHEVMYTIADIERLALGIDEAANVNGLGEMNRVMFAEVGGSDTSIKVPRNTMHGDRIFREAFISAVLQDAPDGQYDTPRIIDFQEGVPQYLAYHYLDGEHLSSLDLQELSLRDKQRLGCSIADFALWLGESVPLGSYPEVAQTFYGVPLGHRRVELLQQRATQRRYGSGLEPWAAYEAATDRMFEDTELLTCEPPADKLGHGDLRADNMLFTRKSGKLALKGVLDFGIAEPSYLEYELRHLPQLGTGVIANLREYLRKRHNHNLDDELLQFWAQVQILTPVSYGIEKQLPLRPGQLAALEHVFPDLDFRTDLPLSQQGSLSVQ